MTLRKTFLFIISLMLLLAALPVFAATLKGGEEVSVAQSERINDDLYAAGGNVSVLGTVQGDLITAGGNILANGGVGVDLIAAGGSVQVLSSVGDDLRLAGGQVLVGDKVGDDAMLAGGDVKLLSSSSVAGDVIAAGGRVVLDGSVAGDVQVWAGEVVINGTIAGDVTLEADTIALGEEAVISGDFSYTSSDEAEIAEGAVVKGETVFEEKKMPAKFGASVGALIALGGLFLLSKLFATLVVAIIAVLVFTRFARALSVEAITNFGKNTLLGFAGLVVTPVGLVIIAVTFIGIFIAGIIGVTYVLALMLAKALAGVVAGALLAKWIKKEIIVNWKWTTLGVVVLQIVPFVPLVGWLVSFVAFLVTLGAFITMTHRRFWLDR